MRSEDEDFDPKPTQKLNKNYQKQRMRLYRKRIDDLVAAGDQDAISKRAKESQKRKKELRIISLKRFIKGKSRNLPE
jgi:hypothetical protein